MGTHKKHVKKIKDTRCIGRGSKAPNMYGRCAKRIESTRCMLKAHNMDQ